MPKSRYPDFSSYTRLILDITQDISNDTLLHISNQLSPPRYIHVIRTHYDITEEANYLFDCLEILPEPIEDGKPIAAFAREQILLQRLINIGTPPDNLRTRLRHTSRFYCTYRPLFGATDSSKGTCEIIFVHNEQMSLTDIFHQERFEIFEKPKSKPRRNRVKRDTTHSQVTDSIQEVKTEEIVDTQEICVPEYDEIGSPAVCTDPAIDVPTMIDVHSDHYKNHIRKRFLRLLMYMLTFVEPRVTDGYIEPKPIQEYTSTTDAIDINRSTKYLPPARFKRNVQVQVPQK